MDGATVEHSDSDSGESWTLLENNQTYGDDVPETPENGIHLDERINDTHTDKDEDTDGISIISDSEPESTPCDVNCVKESSKEPSPAEDPDSPLLVTPPIININNHNESVSEETDFLGDNVKYKTYVHKRNPRVGTILDIIMLGTFVITAGMALGHLWSCKNECTTQTSVNKILSNLYKLQEENAYLRSKLKEITEATSHQLEYQQKPLTNKVANKRHRCKKIFEEPDIKNSNLGVEVKCVDDNKSDVIHDPLLMPKYEKELLDDVEKMKQIYDRNKEWLDAEVVKQFEKFEKSKNFGSGALEINNPQNMGKKLGSKLIPQNYEQTQDPQDTAMKSHRQINLEKQLGPTYFEIPLTAKPEIGDTKQTKTESSDAVKSHRFINLELQLGSHEGINPSNLNDQSLPEKKITYADSLKTDQPLHKSQRNENYDVPNKWIKDLSGKRKRRDDEVLLDLNSSEDDIRKDDRYTGPKIKHEKKKHDRQKSQKKQKRNNKYEQWEMKGGYLKDFDEFSVTSSLDNDISTNNPEKKFLNTNFENYINKFIEIENNISNKDLSSIGRKTDEVSNKVQKRSLKGDRKKWKTDSDWYDKMSALRAEARLKLQHEMFGENTSNNAAWYFRRMQKREQCRTQKDNSTFKKFSKRKMNFKMKR